MSTRSVLREHGDLRFHWLEAGPRHGEPLVLLHGFMAHSMAFRRVVDALAPDFRLVIPDLPGHGRDESYQATAVEPTIESLTDWARALREVALGDVPAHWLGHSLGANLAYRLAHERPDLVRTLSLVSPGLRVPAQPLVSRALHRLPAWIASLGANRLGLSLYQPLNWRGAPMTRAEEIAYLAPLRSADRMRFILSLGARIVDGNHTAVRALDVPAIVIWGEHDHILPLEDAWHIGERLEAPVHVMRGSGHAPMEDTPDELVAILREFLRGR